MGSEEGVWLNLTHRQATSQRLTTWRAWWKKALIQWVWGGAWDSFCISNQLSRMPKLRLPGRPSSKVPDALRVYWPQGSWWSMLDSCHFTAELRKASLPCATISHQLPLFSFTKLENQIPVCDCFMKTLDKGLLMDYWIRFLQFSEVGTLIMPAL